MFRSSAEAAQVTVRRSCAWFLVELAFNGESHALHVLAFKSVDAITSALDMFFDGELEMPDGMNVKAHPANVLRAAR